MRYVSVCSGIECASVAFDGMGWDPVAFAEIEPFPNAVLQHHYPNVTNLGDFSKVDWIQYKDKFDILIGGTPCFGAGTLILTKRGLIPIEDVVVGDVALTHKNNYKKVSAIGNKTANVGVLKGQGNSGTIVTDNHPYWVRSMKRVYKDHVRVREFKEPQWKNAVDVVGDYWAMPSSYPKQQMPKIAIKGKEQNNWILNDSFFWLLGAYLGNGWTRQSDRRGYVLLCDGKHKKPVIEDKIKESGMSYNKLTEKTTVRYQIASKALARWITKQFNKGASLKTLPTWVYSLSKSNRTALFDGYVWTDGHRVANTIKTTTVSKKLSLSMRLLATSLGFSVSTVTHKPKRKQCVIEGRSVNEKDCYINSYTTNSRSAFSDGDKHWLKIKSYTPLDRETTVYNLEVADDNSYVADGMVVHNCQSFSVAGMQKGLQDARGDLAIEYCRILKDAQPKYFIWENVPGCQSTNGGRDFREIVTAFTSFGYGVCWRILDSQYFGVPQRRRRVYVVGSLRNLSSGKILFEQESRTGNIKTVGKTREKTTRKAIESPTAHSRVEDSSPIVVNARQDPIYAEDLSLPLGAADRGHAVMCKEGESTYVGNAEGGALDKPFLTCSNLCKGVNNQTPHVIEKNIAIYENHPNDSRVKEVDIVPTITQRWGTGGGNVPFVQRTDDGERVRRLTPLECERLQGLPEGYTGIPYRNKPPEKCPDGPRYKAIGNGFAVPVIRWLAQRIDGIEHGQDPA